MGESSSNLLFTTEELMKKAYNHLVCEFGTIRAGRAHPNMLNGIQVLYYGNMVSLDKISSIISLDARTLVIKPFEKTLLQDIEKSIKNSNLGFNPQNDSEIIKVIVPPMSEERRRGLVKLVKGEAEKGRIAIRNIRKNIKDKFKDLQMSQDDVKKLEKSLQDLTDRYIKDIDSSLKRKEEELMSI